jgi:hypothetical protein
MTPMNVVAIARTVSGATGVPSMSAVGAHMEVLAA